MLRGAALFRVKPVVCDFVAMDRSRLALSGIRLPGFALAARIARLPASPPRFPALPFLGFTFGMWTALDDMIDENNTAV